MTGTILRPQAVLAEADVEGHGGRRPRAAADPPPERRRRRHRSSPRPGHVRWGRVALVVLAVAALGFGVTDDLSTQVRLHHTEVAETETRQTTATLTSALRDAQRNLEQLGRGERVDQAALNVVEGELSVADQRLAQAQSGLALSNLDVAEIKTCITGTQTAIGEIAAGESQSAISAVAGVASNCESLETPGAGSAVYPFDFPDPDVINVGGTYFAYGTNAAGGNVQIIESTDLTHWSLVGDALPELPAWANAGATWAPGVFELHGSFIMFYATQAGPTECISVATATTPTGPFIDQSAGPVVCQRRSGGSIDPAPFVSAGGAPYLVWKSNGGSGQPPTIWSEPLTASGTALAPGSSPVALLQPSQAWESGVVEGPFMWISDGGYYLFYSGNQWDSPDYAEGVAFCSGPLGPCVKPLASPILTSEAQFSGPGGASVFVDSAGNPWIAFHGWLPQAVGYPNARLLFLRPLSFQNSVPVVGQPG